MREKNEHRHGKPGNEKVVAELAVISYKPKNAKDCQQPSEAEREGWNRCFFGAFQKETALPHLDF